MAVVLSIVADIPSAPLDFVVSKARSICSTSSEYRRCSGHSTVVGRSRFIISDLASGGSVLLKH